MSSWRISDHQPFGARHWHSYLIVTLVSNLTLRKLQIRDEGRLSTTSSKLQHFPFNLSLNAFQRLSLEREERPGAPSCRKEKRKRRSQHRKHSTRKIGNSHRENLRKQDRQGLKRNLWRASQSRVSPTYKILDLIWEMLHRRGSRETNPSSKKHSKLFRVLPNNGNPDSEPLLIFLIGRWFQKRNSTSVEHF